MCVTVIGSHLCPDTLYALCKLREKNFTIDFKNLSSSLPDLSLYLAIRETDEIYKKIRENGGIGIPLFELPDGKRTLDLEAVLSLKQL